LTVSLIKAGADTWARQDRASDRHGSHRFLSTSLEAAKNRYAYLTFGRPWPLGTQPTVPLARLYLYARGVHAGPYNITVKIITAKWSANRLDWNNKPGVGAATGVFAVGAGGLTDGQEVIVDITALISSVASGGVFYGLRVEVDATSARNFYSLDSGSPGKHPYLYVDWNLGPDAPDNLKPSGSRAISLAQPTYTYIFRDTEGDKQQALQIQIDDAADMATPLHDTGEIATDLQERAPAFTITQDVTRYWRGRAKDSYGIWSPWSEVVQFIRRAKGTLVITNPAVSPNNFVEETTPPISWTFTPPALPAGTVQEFVEMILEERDSATDLWVQVWHYPKTATAGGSITVPSGYLKKQSPAEYRVTIRVWDTVDREDTPGDPSYVEAQRTFDLRRSAVPAAVTSLTVTPRTDPGIDLAWVRAIDPDYFEIVVDGVTVEDRIEGTLRALTFWKARPYIQHTIEVVAVVTDVGVLKRSTGNDTETLTPTVGGTWLFEEDGSNVVVFLEGEGVAGIVPGNIGVEGETHVLLHRRSPVRITDITRGQEGKIGGLLVAYLGVSAATYRDRFNALVGKENTVPIRVVYDDQNYEVILGKPSLVKLARDRWAAEVEVWQTADFLIEVPG
jgi:hypothetical protein